MLAEPEVESTIVDETGLKLDDLFPDEHYSVSRFARALGISVQRIQNAVRDGRIAHQHGHIEQAFTRSVLDWIQTERVELKVDNWEVAYIRRRRQTAAEDERNRAAAEAARQADPVEQAFDALAVEEGEDKAAAESEAEREQRAAVEKYVGLLVAEAAGGVVDEADYRECITSLSLDRRRVKKDREIVRDALVAEKAHVDLDAASEVFTDVHARRRALMAKHQEQQAPLDAECKAARARYEQAEASEAKLAALRKARPELFDQGDVPNFLVEMKPTTKPKTGKRR